MEPETKKDKKREPFKEVFVLEDGVTAQFAQKELTIQGTAGKVTRIINTPLITLKVENNQLTLTSIKTSSREKKTIGTWKAHIKNMIKGVQTPHRYKLKLCSGHFPMTAAVSGNKFTIKNFFSEKVPREIIIPEDVKVEVKGGDIEIISPDKELAGRCASSIEQLTRRTGFDRRVFQDGAYIVEKL